MSQLPLIVTQEKSYSPSRREPTNVLNDDPNNNISNIQKGSTSSTHLSEILNSLDWQSRKRKERQDSTSSVVQDRKLIRSNSEEHVPNCQEVIRRVSSHDDFKKIDSTNRDTSSKENNLNLTYIAEAPVQDIEPESNELTFQLIHDHEKTGKPDEIDIEHENERRRNSERFLNLKSRPSGRKSPRIKQRKASKKDHASNDIESSTSTRNSNTHSSKDYDFSENIKSRDGQEKPWENHSEYTPIVCRRFEDYKFDDVHDTHVKNIKNDHRVANYNTSDYSKSSVKSFMNAENNKTREIMKKEFSNNEGVFLSPDDRIKKINKRIHNLKEKIQSYEENFENEYGYRLSHNDKCTDRYVKNYVSEINKLRKERSHIKADPLKALGYKYSANGGNISGEEKLARMKDTVDEIEKVII